MNSRLAKEHSKTLAQFATVARERAEANPSDPWLAIVAKNQVDNASAAGLTARVSDALDAGEVLEWRFIGSRLHSGALPLDFLSRLAAPLNSLLVRAAYFARNKVDAMYGAADELSREIDLSLVGVAPGSTRLFIRGSAVPDLTGSSAFTEGVEGLFGVLSHNSNFAEFYDQIGEIGERAAEALHDTLKAVETEECSMHLTWHTSGQPRQFDATYDNVVHMRALLEGIKDDREYHESLSGRITLLSINGRLQLERDDGSRATVRFKPRAQAALVGTLTLNTPVQLDVVAKVTVDPVSGGEIKRYSLISLDSPLLSQ
jgi:hypothetical protein